MGLEVKLSPKQIIQTHDKELDMYYKFEVDDMCDEYGICFKCYWSNTVEIPSDNPINWDRYADFYCKWDGCHNYACEHNDEGMIHGCSPDNFVSFLRGMTQAYNLAAAHFIAHGRSDWRILK